MGMVFVYANAYPVCKNATERPAKITFFEPHGVHSEEASGRSHDKHILNGSSVTILESCSLIFVVSPRFRERAKNRHPNAIDGKARTYHLPKITQSYIIWYFSDFTPSAQIGKSVYVSFSVSNTVSCRLTATTRSRTLTIKN